MPTDSLPVPTLVLALPDPLLSSALAAALSAQCAVVAEVESWGAMEDALEEYRPTATVVDIVVGRDLLLAHLNQLVVAYPATRFVVCSPQPDPSLIQRALLAGAAAVVGHDVSSSAFGGALAALCRSGTWPDGLGHAAAIHTPRRAPLAPLSARLRQVNELLWQGLLVKEMVDALNLSRSTVERHITEIRKAYAVAEGLPGPWEEARTARRGRKYQGEGN